MRTSGAPCTAVVSVKQPAAHLLLRSQITTVQHSFADQHQLCLAMYSRVWVSPDYGMRQV